MEFDVSYVCAALIILLIFALIWAFSMWKKLTNAEERTESVAWTVCESDHVRGNMPLWAHFNYIQNHIHIREKYRICEREWPDVKRIIKQYQDDLIQLYFTGRVSIPINSKYGLQGKDYFAFMLYVYLCEHQVREHNLVFHKMNYITYMYCKSHPGLQKSVPGWNESVLQELLDNDLASAASNPG